MSTPYLSTAYSLSPGTFGWGVLQHGTFTHAQALAHIRKAAMTISIDTPKRLQIGHESSTFAVIICQCDDVYTSTNRAKAWLFWEYIECRPTRKRGGRTVVLRHCVPNVNAHLDTLETTSNSTLWQHRDLVGWWGPTMSFIDIDTLFLCTGICSSTIFATGPKLWHTGSLSHRSPTESDRRLQHPFQLLQVRVDLWCASGSRETKPTPRLLWDHSLQMYLQATLWNCSSTCFDKSQKQSNTLFVWYTTTQFSWYSQSP